MADKNTAEAVAGGNGAAGAAETNIVAGPNAAEALLEVEHLHKAYGEKVVLEDISLTVKRGEVVVIIGPSGCGKSTFLRCLNLMNIEIPRCVVGGQIIYHDHNINTREENLFELRKSIGMVFQQPTPFRKSIRENILFAPKRHGLVAGKALAKKMTSE